MDAGEKGILPKICGRLGDLAFIDGKYDVAISVACPGLDNIVVRHSADAVKCVEYLRQQKIGRCCFLTMDKIPEEINQQMRKQFVPPAGSERLFD